MLPLFENTGDVRTVVGGLGLSLGVDVPAPTADLPRSLPTARRKIVQTAVLVNALNSFDTLHHLGLVAR